MTYPALHREEVAAPGLESVSERWAELQKSTGSRT